MFVIAKNKNEMLYYYVDGDGIKTVWSSLIREAKQFESIGQAEYACVTKNIGNGLVRQVS